MKNNSTKPKIRIDLGVYIASGNTPLFYCLDQKTGKPHWIVKLGHRVEESTLCIYRKMVYVLSADGYVHAIE